MRPFFKCPVCLVIQQSLNSIFFRILSFILIQICRPMPSNFHTSYFALFKSDFDWEQYKKIWKGLIFKIVKIGMIKNLGEMINV